MGGFLSAKTAMIICKAEKTGHLDMDKLRQGAFTNALDPNGQRLGWVGLGDMLDTDNFFLALTDADFAGFSFRLDSRRPSAAVIRLQTAEKIREEEKNGQKVDRKRRKEIKEAVTARLTSEAPFVPAVFDCLWESRKGRLMIGTTSEKMVEKILDFFKGSFGISCEPLFPEKDMAAVFQALQKGGLKVEDYYLRPLGTANLATANPAEEKSSVIVQNNAEAVDQALDDGLAIHKTSLFALRADLTPEEIENEDSAINFTLDANLVVSGLRFPKAEKGSDQEATFLINADVCASVADMVESLAREDDA